MAEFVAGSLNPVFSFAFHPSTIFMFDIPRGSTATFTALICLHPQSLRAYAEPRRASARLVIR